MKILVTGAAGYIGSHTVVELVNAGHRVVAIDNLNNSNRESLRRAEVITGKSIPFYKLDVRNSDALKIVFDKHNIDAVVHFAGLKAVGESVYHPLLYYKNNLESAISLIETMELYKVKNLVFSSSATVYGDAPTPYVETSPIGQGITSPYGQSKCMIEQIIKDVSVNHPDNKYTVLRYFNPVGAHESGLIGEDPAGTPNNLMPFVSQVAVGKRKELAIFGNDYDTPDGTCVRDYIHVVDLAKGHLAAIMNSKPGYNVYNLGSGTGTSVLELVSAFSDVCGFKIPYVIKPRRPGDLPSFYSNSQKAHKELGWKTEKLIHDMCRDTWRWQSQNKNGYSD